MKTFQSPPTRRDTFEFWSEKQHTTLCNNPPAHISVYEVGFKSNPSFRQQHMIDTKQNSCFDSTKQYPCFHKQVEHGQNLSAWCERNASLWRFSQTSTTNCTWKKHENHIFLNPVKAAMVLSLFPRSVYSPVPGYTPSSLFDFDNDAIPVIFFIHKHDPFLWIQSMSPKARSHRTAQ